MSTVEKHVKIYENKDNNASVLYPENTDVDVKISSSNSNANIPSSIENLHDIINLFGSGAFDLDIRNITIEPDEWVDNQYTITNSRITSSSIIDIYYNSASLSCISECSPTYTQTDGSITITVSSIPNTTVIIDVLKVG